MLAQSIFEKCLDPFVKSRMKEKYPVTEAEKTAIENYKKQIEDKDEELRRVIGKLKQLEAAVKNAKIKSDKKKLSGKIKDAKKIVKDLQKNIDEESKTRQYPHPRFDIFN